MANDDKGRRKWGGISQDTRSDCRSDRGRSIGVMRGGASSRAPPRAIYTPGSGPLKKSGRSSEDFGQSSNGEERTKPISVQDRLKPSQFNNSNVPVPPVSVDSGGISERLNNARGNQQQNSISDGADSNSHYNHPDSRRRSKKPEQQLYVPKKVQEALAERDVANRSPVRRAPTPPVLQPQQQQHQQHQGGIGWERDSGNRDWETQSNRSQRNDRNDRNKNRGGRHNDGSNNMSNRGRPDDHGKRYSGNRRNRNPNENEEREWRSKSPMSGRNYGNRRDYQREVRQGSEPLSVTPNNANEYNRTRDTRSVDPPGYPEKFPRKPPSGRQGFVKIPSNIDNLPPRLQRKYLAENGLDMPLGGTLGGGNHLYAKPNDDWDGSTVTFQGSSGYNNPSSMRNNYPPQSSWSNTIPARSRGRGRLRHEENEPPMGNYRPVTPDQYSAASSRSHTPSQEYMTRSYERRGSNSTMYTSMESLSRADNVPMAPARLISPAVSSHSNSNRGGRPPSPPDIQRRNASPITTNTMSHHYNQQGERANNNADEATSSSDKTKNERYNSNHSSTKSNEPYSSLPDMASIATLNWSEDVELDLANDNEVSQQQESPSRSSSVMSSRDNGSISGRSGAPMGPPIGVGVGRNRSYKKKRRDQRHSGAIEGDRSCSRDDGNRGKSRERMNNQQNRENDGYRIDPSNSNRRYEPGRRHRNGKMPRSRECSRDRIDCRGSSIRHVDDSRRSADENWRSGKRSSICDSDDVRGSSMSSNPHQTHSNVVPLSNSDTNVGRSISPIARGTNFQGPGVLVLPERNQISPRNTGMGPRGLPQQQQHNQMQMQPRKTLFDPNNPGRPIIVRSPGNRASLLPRDKDPQFSSGIPPSYNPHVVPTGPQHFGGYHAPPMEVGMRPPAPYVPEQLQGNSRPSWYEPTSQPFRDAKDPYLLLDVETIDRQLVWLLSDNRLIANWEKISKLRETLKETLRILIETDIKFCQSENVEQHFWKLLYYNMIEMLRKMMPKEPGENRDACKQMMLTIIDEGTSYFENLLGVLENKYKFKLEVYLVSATPPNGLGFVGLALVCAQKIFLFLGDLARYKEQANETTNYGKSRQWYLKAQQINPKNGRPYNQLALLAHYARRKLDAVYYYMRSLMASNPFHSARESLIALFDENRKKYESTERKRKEEREWKERARMKEKEGANNAPGALRRETWVHPADGKRVRRTTSSTTVNESKFVHSDSEELSQLTSVEVNKRFITSYLHVHGKLITKIGMETFQEAAIQMLREFRTLLQHSPLPIPETRLLQLLALNMFAIDTTQLKDSQMEQGYRSEVQERALVVSLQMFNLILERGVALLKSQFEEDQRHRLIVNEDMQVLLPAIKIWCDWMLCHSTVWNPPPSCTDYRVGPPGDSWSRLATMVNLLEMLKYSRQIVIQAKDVVGRENEVDLIKLPEDTTLSGFTPLMSNPQDPCYADKSEDMEVAQMCLRIQKILFFGEVFLCGLETPVLKLQKSENGHSEYVSVVEASSPGSPSSPPEQSDSELLVESDIDDEDDGSNSGKLRSSSDSWHVSQNSNATVPTGEIRSLIERKGELERRQRKQERHRQQVQAILKKSNVAVEIEVRPRLLVPDTNCFIDYLPQLQSIARATSGTQPLYTLMIPLVVLNELEGLAKGGDSRGCPPASRAALNPEHIARVGESAKAALAFARSRNPAIKCMTTRGTVLTSSTFTVEEDVTQDEVTRNDDRILVSCLNLCKSGNKDQQSSEESEPRRLKREVVLLTEDRNLRVKALARDVPVREVPDFTKWAGLG